MPINGKSLAIFVIACFFSLFFIIPIIGYSDWIIFALPVMGILIFSIGLFGEVRRKVWLVYRFTQSGAEICHWRAYPKSLFTGIRVIFIGLGVVAVIAGFITEMGLLVIAGPISIALAWGSFAFSKDYEEDMRAFFHWEFIWPYVTAACYDHKRNVINLHFTFIMTEQLRQDYIAQGIDPNTVVEAWDTYIFPTPELTSQVIHLVESSLQNGVKLQHKKVELPEIV